MGQKIKPVEEIPGCFEFYCPGCKREHYVYTNCEKTPAWGWNKSLDRPTFSPSIMTKFQDTVCHMFITDGKIQFLNDSTHGFAGLTIEMYNI